MTTTTHTTTALITQDFNGLPIVFREDGYINMTKAAKHYRKRLRDFLATQEAQEYIKTLSKRAGIPAGLLLVIRPGRNGGTWAHPKLAVRVARWLDVDFEVWCDLMIDNILHGTIQTTVALPSREALAVDSVVTPLRARILALEEAAYLAALDDLRKRGGVLAGGGRGS